MMPLINLSGRVFGRLTVVERVPDLSNKKAIPYWKCICSCGTECVIKGSRLRNGSTKSCGCLQAENAHLDVFRLPHREGTIAAARSVWLGTYREMSFDDFYPLAQKDCFYCGRKPHLIKQTVQKNGVIFTYNTLDRINSYLGHTIDNVVPACLMCNMCKLDRTLEEFNLHIERLINRVKISPSEYRQLAISKEYLSVFQDPWRTSLLAQVRLMLGGTYYDSNLTLDQFYCLITTNCYYCGIEPSNKRSCYVRKNTPPEKAMPIFTYNGLDRVDNNLVHIYDNVVPSCKWCNSAKGELTLAEFQQWIDRLRAFRLTANPCSLPIRSLTT